MGGEIDRLDNGTGQAAAGPDQINTRESKIAIELQRGNNRLVFLGIVIAAILTFLAIVVAIGIAVWSDYRDSRRDASTTTTTAAVVEPTLEAFPDVCSSKACNTPESPIKVEGRHFNPGTEVELGVLAPNGLTLVPGSNTPQFATVVRTDDAGRFTWVFWWQPGMQIGRYTVLANQTSGDLRTTETFELEGESVTSVDAVLPSITLTRGGKSGRSTYYSLAFKTPLIITDKDGRYENSKLCFTSDGPDHWVTAVLGTTRVTSDIASWEQPEPVAETTVTPPNAAGDKQRGGYQPIKPTFVLIGTDESADQAHGSIDAAKRLGLSPAFAVEVNGKYKIVVGSFTDQRSVNHALTAFSVYGAETISGLAELCDAQLTPIDGSIVSCASTEQTDVTPQSG